MSSSAQSRWDLTVPCTRLPAPVRSKLFLIEGVALAVVLVAVAPVTTWPALGALSPVAIGVGAVIAILGTVTGASTDPASPTPLPAEA
ncbi:hypothetical protein [Streptomyces sp. NPDC048584]|uniref:hypothetical protein n=1 Tax=Streptomyces sp. NPDC048584 TaxID=3365573 RepID=UPI00371E1D03